MCRAGGGACRAGGGVCCTGGGTCRAGGGARCAGGGVCHDGGGACCTGAGVCCDGTASTSPRGRPARGSGRPLRGSYRATRFAAGARSGRCGPARNGAYEVRSARRHPSWLRSSHGIAFLGLTPPGYMPLPLRGRGPAYTLLNLRGKNTKPSAFSQIALPTSSDNRVGRADEGSGLFWSLIRPLAQIDRRPEVA